MVDEESTPKEEEVSVGRTLKNMQMNLLKKMESGSMNQNDLMAFMQMLQKEEPESMKEIMQMSAMMQMLHPQQDPMSQVMPLILMDGMKGDGDSKLEKKIEDLERQIRESREDKQYNEVIREIRDMKTAMSSSKDGLGTKEFLGMILSKDDKVAEMYRAMGDKDRQAFQDNLKMVMEFSKRQAGQGDIGSLGEQLKQLKEISGSLGIGGQEKSNTEIIRDMVGGVADSLTKSEGFNVALSGIGNKMTAEAQEKLMRVQSGRPAPRTMAVPARPVGNPNPGYPAPAETVDVEPAVRPLDAPQTDQFGSVIVPDLIDISSGPPKADRRRAQQ